MLDMTPRRVIALLRGVNVGGHRKVPMTALRKAMSAAGAGSVATYLQSGNLAFDTALGDTQVADLVSDTIAAEIGVDGVEVVVRDRPGIAEVIANNPYPLDDPTNLHVMFLGEGVDPAWFSALDLAPYAPEEATVGDRQVWFHLPGGLGRSRLMGDLPKLQRGTPAAGALVTVRNWRTVLALAEL